MSEQSMVDEHTPGPWWTDAKYDGSEFGCSVIAARTDCGPLPGNPTRGQVAFATAILHTDARKREANARLIAAAPDLLEALKAARELLSWWQGERGDDIHSAVMESADAAIAKASGVRS